MHDCVQVSKDHFALVNEAEPIQSEEMSAESSSKKTNGIAPKEAFSADSNLKRFKQFGFLYSKEGYIVEQELKSKYEDGIYEIMNYPILDADGNITRSLGLDYDVCYLANCQAVDSDKLDSLQDPKFQDEPRVKRSSTNASVTSTYGVAVLFVTLINHRSFPVFIHFQVQTVQIPARF